MPNENSTNDIFRFIQLRPKRPLRETPTVPLLDDTALARSMASAPPARRAALADAALTAGNGIVHRPGEVPLGDEIISAIDASKADDTTADLVAALPNVAAGLNSSAFTTQGNALSDTLLAAFHATQIGGLQEHLTALQRIHRVYHLLRQQKAESSPDAVPLTEFLSWRIVTPAFPSATNAPLDRTDRIEGVSGRPRVRARAEEAAAVPQARSLETAIEELSRFDRPGQVDALRRNVSRETLDLVAGHGLNLDATPIDSIIQNLLDVRKGLGTLVVWPQPVVTPQPGVTLPPPPAMALVRPAGVADLLVVKQQIKRYEAGEIAHVENVLIGEKKSRAHRQLDRREETFTTESETTREHQTELETADRFELNREASEVIKNDLELGASLSLSGKYGPSVEFSSNFEMDLSHSTEETSKSSSRFARDVVNRSLDRVTERVREQRTRTTLSETEETNLHELNNDTGHHVRGVYQFIDKVYEAQVFNYGVRAMFDFMVPEPASFLWYLEAHPQLDLDLPPPPPKLDLVAPDARFINEFNAFGLAATYGATDVEAAPPLYKRLTVGFQHGADNASESDQPHSNTRAELTLPTGYGPLRARIRGMALTDENPVIGITFGARHVVWQPSNADRIGVSDGKELAHSPELTLDLSTDAYEPSDSKLGVALVAWETNTYAIDVVIVVRRTADELDRWRVATYKKIRTAYDEKVRQHDQLVAGLKAEAEGKAERDSRRPFGAPPAENTKTINTELKKHCISILTQQWYDAFDATRDGTPPFFDFQDAAGEGAYVRFFEQAFEWDQEQYVFYPYFWARKTTWIDRFIRQDVDPNFAEFLKAGSARVVVPVRPGFEVAVTYFLETGKLWGGDGEPPEINTPLYVSIVDEIRERTGAPQGEIAVGDPWDVRVPTALAIVREAGDLPAWERVAPGEWKWQPVGAP